MRILQSANPNPKVIDESDEINLDKHQSDIVDAKQQREIQKQKIYQRIEEKREEKKRRQLKIEKEKKKKVDESKMTREEWIESRRNGGLTIDRNEEQLKRIQEKKKKQEEEEKKQEEEEEEKKQEEEKEEGFDFLEGLRQAERIMQEYKELSIKEQKQRIEELPQTVQKLDELGIGELVILPMHPKHKLKRIMPRIPQSFPVVYEMDDMWDCADEDHPEPDSNKIIHFPGDDRVGVIIYQCTHRYCEITVCSVCVQRNVEENLETFQKLREEAEQKELFKQQQEEDRKNGIGAEEVKLGDTAKIPQHKHELHRVDPKKQSLEDKEYWFCNGTEMIEGGCISGYQEIEYAEDDPYYTCKIEECDIDLCQYCVKHFLEEQ